MIDRDITVTDLSRKMGIIQQNLSRKLQNPAEDYKITYLQNIAKALNCEIQVNIVDSETGNVLYCISDDE